MLEQAYDGDGSKPAKLRFRKPSLCFFEVAASPQLGLKEGAVLHRFPNIKRIEDHALQRIASSCGCLKLDVPVSTDEISHTPSIPVFSGKCWLEQRRNQTRSQFQPAPPLA
ncbi:hypothetical protein [Rufibacter psychrotolerans]|uniref:hypothetical protein n=1 Tax=Rufibacter psychrotolerans TaxID=2812556 RepID=UPI001967B501|nr:hypothetical protein [Rufibacter sp. SYSU D00308]